MKSICRNWISFPNFKSKHCPDIFSRTVFRTRFPITFYGIRWFNAQQNIFFLLLLQTSSLFSSFLKVGYYDSVLVPKNWPSCAFSPSLANWWWTLKLQLYANEVSVQGQIKQRKPYFICSCSLMWSWAKISVNQTNMNAKRNFIRRITNVKKSVSLHEPMYRIGSR